MTSDDPTGQVPIQPPPQPSAPPPEAAQPPPPQPPQGAATATASSSPQTTWKPRPADTGRSASLVFGVLFLVVGGWFFATTTLGLDLPDLDWGQFWPVILIVIGLAIVLRSLDRARS
jgi:LiaI-LiaF-like transmembrane region